MRRSLYCLVICSLGVVALAPVMLAQTVEQTVEETQERFAAWVADVNEFVGEVRFDEGDLRSLLDNWDDFSVIGENLKKDSEEGSEEMPDFGEILEDEDYRRWASQAGVDPEDWLRKSMRIFATMMRGQVLSNMAIAEAQLPAQMERFEAQRSEIGEEMYQQLKQAMENTLATMKNMTEAAGQLPEPSAAEKVLLDKYNTELSAAFIPDKEQDGDR
ncbi:MAG: hypothetical protein WBC09_19665 [Thermoanaerobaculia bacterium]